MSIYCLLEIGLPIQHLVDVVRSFPANEGSSDPRWISNSTSLGNAADDIITWNRITTFGNPYQEARAPLDDDAASCLTFRVSLFSTLTSPPLTSSSDAAPGFGVLLHDVPSVKRLKTVRLISPNQRKENFLSLVAGFSRLHPCDACP